MPIAAYLGRNLNSVAKAHNLLPPHGVVGLELELEGREEWPDVNGWEKVADNSLRDGIEYVFSGPQGGAKAVQSIKAMANSLLADPPHNSFRCSTHCHMDVSDLEFPELKRVVMAYTMMEPVMFDHCSLERRYSNFCTPFFQNTYLPRLFTQYMGNDDNRKIRAMANWPKYTALNLKPIASYGSIEFRGSHALTTEAELLGLPQRMLHLKRVAKEFEGTDIQFVEHIRNLRVHEVFQSGLLVDVQPNEMLMDQAYASAIGIATGNVSRAAAQVGGIDLGQIAQAAAERPRRQDPLVVLNQDMLARYHLFPTRNMRTSELLILISHLHQMGGVRKPRLMEFLDPMYRDKWAAMGGNVNVQALIDHHRINVMHLGL